MFEKVSDVFITAAAKYLRAVDVTRENSIGRGSNQHEIGGLTKAGITQHLGTPAKGKTKHYDASMHYLSDDEVISVKATLSWYDTRAHQEHRSPEYRLYYPDNEVTSLAKEGDFFIIAVTPDIGLHLIFCESNSETEIQLRSIFGAFEQQFETSLSNLQLEETKIELPVQMLLSEIGIELYQPKSQDDAKLEFLAQEFGEEFPTTKRFSEVARQLTQITCDPVSEPDAILVAWMSEEERLFKLFERERVAEQLKSGFGEHGDDVDLFISFSLSVQNRRKSRSGHAFENHIEYILKKNNVQFVRSGRTEGKKKPDFLMPSNEAYADKTFLAEKLFILGAKTTCKDRWRQVLSEGIRVSKKHLITLQPAISEDQLTEMEESRLQLVVPLPIQQQYTAASRIQLMSFRELIGQLPKLSV